jgi:DNA polymerase III epsilon subunit-like protein
MAKSEVYISLDIEADGPIPGPYSMISFGLAVCGTFDGRTFEPVDPAERTFYAELKPISNDFVPDALAVSGLDRDRLLVEGRDPADAMDAAAAWVAEVTGDADPVVVAYPLGFDWMWLYWYFMRFAAAGSPFSFSRHLDIKTIYATKARTTVARSTKRQMPGYLRAKRPHTHNALDDALEQAELFQKLFRWEGVQPVPR